MKKLDDKDLKKVDGGSTRIILFSQTFAGKANRTGSNTIRSSGNTIGAKKPFKSYNLPNTKKAPVSKPASRKNQRTK